MASQHPLAAPLVALAALGLIILICRWVFSTDVRDERAARRLARARARGDHGLLVPVVTTDDEADGIRLRDVLRDKGLRATVAEGADEGTWAVLVFRADADRARRLVAG